MKCGAWKTAGLCGLPARRLYDEKNGTFRPLCPRCAEEFEVAGLSTALLLIRTLVDAPTPAVLS